MSEKSPIRTNATLVTGQNPASGGADPHVGHDRPHIVIVGGGFGGLYAAKRLKHRPVRITLLDRRNHHLFQPFLYQVATAGLSPGDIAAPIRSILRRQKNVTVLLAEVERVALANREVILTDGERIAYDHLILATGARHSYFGHDEWEAAAPGLKTIEDALEIRRRVFLAFEAAERQRDPRVQQALLTFVVIGGGPTGVELAGALAEIACQTLTRDFRSINPRDARILLLEAAPRILLTFPEDLAARARQDLASLGVEVRTGTPVTAVSRERVIVGQESISTYTTLWAAGVTASPVARTLGVALDRAGRILIDYDLTVPGYSEVAVVGDLAALTDVKTGKPLPGVATVAIQQGRHAADNIWRACQGMARLPFRYRERGAMATIGRARAIADLGQIQLSGFSAWLVWVVVHIYFLIGFEDRILVMIQWMWAYLTQQRGNRLITSDTSLDASLPQLATIDQRGDTAGEAQGQEGSLSRDQPRPQN